MIYLRCLSEKAKSWADWVHWAEFWHNTSHHIRVGMTLFEVVYRRKPPTLTHYLPRETSVALVSQVLVDRDEVLRQLKDNLEQAQQRKVKYANAHRKDVSFQVNDMFS